MPFYFANDNLSAKRIFVLKYESNNIFHFLMEPMIIFGIALAVLGIIGSVVPLLPGPVFSFLAIVLLFISKGSSVVPVGMLGVFAVAMVLVIIVDYAAPILGAKFFGASRKGVWGAVIGGFFGIFFFPPLGIFMGAFLGAVAGEILSGKSKEKALKAGIGTLLGSFSVIIMQVIFSITAAAYFFMKAF